MAKLKMLKLPKKPKLGKKPAQSASLSTKQAWLRRNAEKKLKWEAKCRAVNAENAKRRAINEASQRASTVIAGIGDITEVRPSSFTAKVVRAKRTSKVGKVKRKKTARKAAKRSKRRR